MKYLFFGGARNTGKTKSIFQLANYLIVVKGYEVISGKIYDTPRDFQCVIEKDNRKVLIQSYSDDIKCIKAFSEFLKKNAGVEIVIIAIRDNSDRMRSKLFEAIGHIDYELEIPLAKVKRGNSRENCLKWYLDNIEKLSEQIIVSDPFNL